MSNTTTTTTTYDDYWNAVLGESETPLSIAAEYELVANRRTLSEWLGNCECEAWLAVRGPGDEDDLPADWEQHHEPALDQLIEAIEELAAEAEDAARCECGDATGVRCESEHEGAVVEFMPEHLRASHEAAGNAGRWPHNGALRLQVSRACAADLLEEHEGWAEEIENG